MDFKIVSKIVNKLSFEIEAEAYEYSNNLMDLFQIKLKFKPENQFELIDEEKNKYQIFIESNFVYYPEIIKELSLLNALLNQKDIEDLLFILNPSKLLHLNTSEIYDSVKIDLTKIIGAYNFNIQLHTVLLKLKTIELKNINANPIPISKPEPSISNFSDDNIALRICKVIQDDCNNQSLLFKNLKALYDIEKGKLTSSDEIFKYINLFRTIISSHFENSIEFEFIDFDHKLYSEQLILFNDELSYHINQNSDKDLTKQNFYKSVHLKIFCLDYFQELPLFIEFSESVKHSENMNSYEYYLFNDINIDIIRKFKINDCDPKIKYLPDYKVYYENEEYKVKKIISYLETLNNKLLSQPEFENDKLKFLGFEKPNIDKYFPITGSFLWKEIIEVHYFWTLTTYIISICMQEESNTIPFKLKTYFSNFKSELLEIYRRLDPLERSLFIDSLIKQSKDEPNYYTENEMHKEYVKEYWQKATDFINTLNSTQIITLTEPQKKDFNQLKCNLDKDNLIFLFNRLKKECYINTDEDFFLYPFGYDLPTNRIFSQIKWIDKAPKHNETVNNQTLIELIDCLFPRQLINSPSIIYDFITKYFIDGNGNLFKRDNLKQTCKAWNKKTANLKPPRNLLIQSFFKDM